MRSELSVTLLIFDQDLEQRVLGALEISNFMVSGRYLSFYDIPETSRGTSILISTWDSIPLEYKKLSEVQNAFLELQRAFLSVILIGDEKLPDVLTLQENSLEVLPELLLSAVPIEFEREKSADALQIFGVAPRVGVRMLKRAIDLNEHFLLFALQKSASPTVIYCSELDEECIAQLFKRILEDKGRYTRQALLITKVPDSPGAKNRVKALKREVQILGITMVVVLPFDNRLQVDGELSKSGFRALSPLFDWIAKPN
jgi:hypothetical protein